MHDLMRMVTEVFEQKASESAFVISRLTFATRMSHWLCKNNNLQLSRAQMAESSTDIFIYSESIQKVDALIPNWWHDCVFPKIECVWRELKVILVTTEGRASVQHFSITRFGAICMVVCELLWVKCLANHWDRIAFATPVMSRRVMLTYIAPHHMT